jgi:hypothetical protein
MKKTVLALFLSVLLFACKNKKGIPDVSDIKVDLSILRFDQDFFSIDTNQIASDLQKLQQKYPSFYGDFMGQILGLPMDTNFSAATVARNFYKSYKSINDSLQPLYKNTNWLKKEIENGFRFVKYYFPDYKPGKIILFIGPFDAPGIAAINDGLAVGLQQFAGRNFSVYQTEPIQQMFPAYISRRFAPEYIPANCMKAIVQDLFPDNSSSLALIEQMIEKGKQWYLLDKFLPSTADSIKTGYTQQQLDWCNENEGLIWSELIKNEDLNSLNPTVIQNYIGEGPFTQGFSPEYSPGNIGPWIGWQIVKKFVSKNPDMKPEEIMKTNARKILEEAKYKPR